MGPGALGIALGALLLGSILLPRLAPGPAAIGGAVLALGAGWAALRTGSGRRRQVEVEQLLADNIESLEATNRELVEARAEVVRAARLASVGTLAAGIAHEVGNPLGAIIGFVDVARRRAAHRQEDTELLDAIRGEALRIDRIVRGLLDHARPSPSEVAPTDPRGVVRRVRELLESQGTLDRVAHHWDLDGRVPPVDLDPHRLEQVLVNLLLNAVDALAGREAPEVFVRVYGDAGEVVRLPARREDDPPGINYMHRRRISRDEGGRGVDPAFSAERVAVIEVADNGPGIPEGDLERIFDPFFTTKDPGKGTGLGLSICMRLVEGMGGRIDVSNRPEGGAKFEIRLPSAREGDSGISSVGIGSVGISSEERHS